MTKESVKATVRKKLTNYLTVSNHRKTPERYAILDAIYGINGHFTLDELSERLAQEYHFPVSRATLYNTLKLFMELRLVIRHSFQGTTKYEAACENSSHCHQVCAICGKVTEVKLPAVDDAIDSLHLKRFHKDGYALYIYGVCSTCQQRMKRKKTALAKQRQTSGTKQSHSPAATPGDNKTREKA